MKIKNHMDFEKTSQVLNIKIHHVATLPTGWTGGLVYLTTDNKVYYHNGTAWIPINSTAGLITGVVGGGGISVSTDGNGVSKVTFVPDDSTLELSSGADAATARIKDAGVTSAKLASNAVITAKIADSNVTTEKLATNAVTTAKITDANVTTDKLANNAVTTVKLTDKNVVFSKIQDIATMTVIGRVAAASGVASEITVLKDVASAGAGHDTLVTATAIKAYVDGAVGGLGNLEGGFDAAAATAFPVGSGGTKKGDYWYVTVAGTVQGTNFDKGDVLIANKDAASTTLVADWIILEVNRDQATLSVLGVVSLATAAEAQAMSNTTKALTPSNLGDVKASDAETQTGAANNKFITPANLSSRTATETRTGLVELATNAEVQTGTDTSRAVTPAGVSAMKATDAETQAGALTTRFVTPASLSSRTATEGRTGIAAVASQAEVNAGTAVDKMVTPAKLQARILDIATTFGKASGTLGDATSTTITVTHNLNTKNVIVQLWEVATGETILTDVARPTVNTIVASFAVAPAANAYAYLITI